MITGLVAIPYLSRILGPDGIGLYSYTYSVVYFFTLFAALGFSTYGVREIARSRIHNGESRTFWEIYLSQVIVGLLTLFAYGLYIILIHEGGYIISSLWGIYLVATILDVSWFLFGCENFKTPTIRNTIIRIVEIASVFIFVKTSDDVWIYVLIISLGGFVGQVALWPLIIRRVRIVHIAWRDVKKHFLPNAVLFLPVIAASIYTSIDKVFLGTLSTMQETGYYSYSETLCKVPLSLLTALGGVMLPRIAALKEKNKYESIVSLINYSLWCMFGASMLISFLITGVASEFVPLFFGADFEPAVPLVILMTLFIPCISITNVLGIQLLIPTNRENEYTKALLIGAITNIVVNTILIPHYAAIGATLGSVFAEMLVTATLLIYLRKDIKINKCLFRAIPFLFVSLFSFCLMILVGNFLSNFSINVWLVIATKIFTGTIAYAGILYSFFSFTGDTLFKRFKSDIFGKQVSSGLGEVR